MYVCVFVFPNVNCNSVMESILSWNSSFCVCLCPRNPGDHPKWNLPWGSAVVVGVSWTLQHRQTSLAVILKKDICKKKNIKEMRLWGFSIIITKYIYVMKILPEEVSIRDYVSISCLYQSYICTANLRFAKISEWMDKVFIIQIISCLIYMYSILTGWKHNKR